jgi:hypothetical protein
MLSAHSWTASHSSSQHHLGQPVVLTHSADGLIHEVDIDVFLAEILDKACELRKRSPESVEFVGNDDIE